jgi:Rieske 2Fe-2S family protein
MGSVEPVTTPPPLDPSRLAAVLRPRAEAALLPPEAYSDAGVLAWELEHLFESAWVCVGREEDVGAPGRVLTAAVGRESVLIVRDEDDRLGAFFNVCQHRGTRLVEEASRSGQAKLICPYHSWTYGLDGRLVAAEHMAGTAGFDRAAAGLTPLPAETLEGWVFVNVSGTAGSLRGYLRDFPSRLVAYEPGALRRAQRRDYDVQANWKLLSENYQECYHCPTIHPELSRVTPYRSARNDEADGPWIGGPMDLVPGCTTMSVSGLSDRPPLPGLEQADRTIVRYYTVLPNLWISLHPDYVLTHTVWPLEPGRTKVVCEWLFHPDAMAGAEFDPSDAVEFWDVVNNQDWRACEAVQMGMPSRGFRGGHLGNLEDAVHHVQVLFARSYLSGGLVSSAEAGLEASASPGDRYEPVPPVARDH